MAGNLQAEEMIGWLELFDVLENLDGPSDLPENELDKFLKKWLKDNGVRGQVNDEGIKIVDSRNFFDMDPYPFYFETEVDELAFRLKYQQYFEI